MTRITVLLATAWLATAAPTFADIPKIDRKIGREPVYQTKSPHYCLLAFGLDAKDHVWLVVDGDSLYVDRNGNGDLTEADEKIAATPIPGRDPEKYGLSFRVGELKVGGRTHKDLNVRFTPLKLYADSSIGKRPDVQAALAEGPMATGASINLDVDVPGMQGGGIGGRVTFIAGLLDLNGTLRFGESSAKAPIVHLGGPLQVTFYGELPTLRIGRETELFLCVGTPGDGPGTFAMICYEDTIPESAKPVAEIAYPATKPEGAPLRETFELKERC